MIQEDNTRILRKNDPLTLIQNDLVVEMSHCEIKYLNSTVTKYTIEIEESERTGDQDKQKKEHENIE